MIVTGCEPNISCIMIDYYNLINWAARGKLNITCKTFKTSYFYSYLFMYLVIFLSSTHTCKRLFIVFRHGISDRQNQQNPKMLQILSDSNLTKGLTGVSALCNRLANPSSVPLTFHNTPWINTSSNFPSVALHCCVAPNYCEWYASLKQHNEN